MANDSGQEKTEAPSERKLKQSRDEGQTPRTQDLSSWASVAACAAVLPMVVSAAHKEVQAVLLRVTEIAQDPDPELAIRILAEGLQATMLTIAPLVLASTVASVAAFLAQGGMHLAWKKLKPSAEKINPVKGIKRLFGVMTWWEGAKTVIKTVALVLVVWWAVTRVMPVLLGSGALPLAATMDAVGGALALLVQVSVLVGVVTAGADFVVQKRKSLKDLRMSKQEVKEENKTTEGNPLIKQAVRSRQIAMSRNRMMSAVATADVVVVNPTHYAVALRYEASKGAPRVLAKGTDLTAARIRERATEHRVPMVEDVALARSLHAACEVGDEIPGELFDAVARVLAFVMALRVRGSAAGVHRNARRSAEVPDGAELRKARRSASRRRSAAAADEGSGSAPAVPRQQEPGRRAAGHGSATMQEEAL